MQKVTFGTSKLPGYEVGSKSSPAIVVLQEWWGITEDIKIQAERLSKEGGYRTLVPDLYKGKLGVHKEEAEHLMDNLDFPNAVAEIKEAVEYLRSTGSPKVGVVGFCMGGALALAAADRAGVECAVVFYGTPPAAICTPSAIKVPVQGHFGRLDKFEGFSDAKTAEKVFGEIPKGLGTLYLYDDTDHAFMNTTEWAAERRPEMGFAEPPLQAQKIAWERVFDFVGKNLKVSKGRQRLTAFKNWVKSL